jgi:hypothetical protein
MDRLSDPIADLAKNRLPEGLKSVGMGLGLNGQPLVDVSSKCNYLLLQIIQTNRIVLFLEIM